MVNEYPTLKPGDKITCRNLKEAQALGANLINNGINYIIHGRTIFVLREEDNGQFKRDRGGNQGE